MYVSILSSISCSYFSVYSQPCSLALTLRLSLCFTGTGFPDHQKLAGIPGRWTGKRRIEAHYVWDSSVLHDKYSVCNSTALRLFPVLLLALMVCSTHYSSLRSLCGAMTPLTTTPEASVTTLLRGNITGFPLCQFSDSFRDNPVYANATKISQHVLKKFLPVAKTNISRIVTKKRDTPPAKTFCAAT